MEKTYRHRKTGELAYYKDGVFKQGGYSIEIGVEPSSEFWTELSYKVLETKVYNCQGISNGTYTEITSIKRLSDGEVFSIGDKINFRGLYGNSSEHKYDTIKGFDLKQDGSLGILYHNGLVGLNKIEKYKESILTTEDNEELFGGENIYGVTDDFKLCYTSIATKENVQRCRVFAKRENAEEYILMNKPLLSLNDILSVWGDGAELFKESPLFKNFKDLAKTKL
jgi:hypothetical protein